MHTITSTRRWLARAVTGATLVVLVACGGKQKADDASAAPTDVPTQGVDNPGPAGTPITAEDCEKQGGRVAGDIGDGKIQCNEGEKEIGRVAIGIEGGVCCVPEGAGAAATAPQ